MRKLTSTLLLLASGVVLNAQLTNGDMETWTNNQWSTVGGGGSGNTYEEPGSGTTRTTHFMRTLNELNDLPNPLTIPLSCWKTDTAHGGSFAARIRSQQFGPYFIPGFLGTGDINISNQTLYLGRPYTSHPNSFSTWYKYNGVAGDSAKFEVIFTLYDALNQVSNVIGYGSSTVTTNTSTWTNLQFNIAWDTIANPDSAIIIAASSGGYNLADFLTSSGQVGSQLWVDDMTLQSGFAGTDNDYINEQVNIYPNPANDYININVGTLPENLRVFVYDMNGKLMLAKVMNSNNYLLDISSLSNGVYGVVIQDDFNLIHRSRIIKK